MAFRVGQKVTLINNDPWEYDAEDSAAGVIDQVYGFIYTIRDIIDYSDGAGVRLVEIKNPIRDYADGSVETTYCESYFRAVVEKSTDTGMAVLREILDRESYTIKTPAKA